MLQTLSTPNGFVGCVAAIGYVSTSFCWLIVAFVTGSWSDKIRRLFVNDVDALGRQTGSSLVAKDSGLTEAFGLFMYGLEFYANRLVVSQLIHFVFGVIVTTSVASRVFDQTEPVLLVNIPVSGTADSRIDR